MASQKLVDEIYELVENWGRVESVRYADGGIPAMNVALTFGVHIAADGLRALCATEAARAKQLGNENDALSWEIRAAFFAAVPG